MRKGQRGFTMVELLAAIVILGIIVTVVSIGVGKLIKNSHKQYYETQEDMLKLAGEEYFSDHRSELPKEIGEDNFVLLSTLVDQKYIDDLVDHKEKSCKDYSGNVSFINKTYTKSAVVVVKVNSKTYRYYPILICPSYQSILSTSTLDCSSVRFDYGTYNSEDWYSNDVSIKVIGALDSTTAWKWSLCSSDETCSQGIYSDGKPTEVLFQQEGIQYGILTLFDTEGNFCEVNTQNIKIDRSGPIIDSINTSEDNNTISLTATGHDTLSGIDHWEYKMGDSNWQVITNSTNKDSISISLYEGGELFLSALDQAGNRSEVSSVTIVLPETDLPVPTIVNPSNEQWTNQSFSLNVSTSYTGEIDHWAYSYDNVNFNTYANSTTATFTTMPYSVERNQLTYIHYCNKDGICSPSASTMIRIDKTAPTYSYSVYHNISCYTFENGIVSNAQTLCQDVDIHYIWSTIIKVIYRDAGSDNSTRTITWSDSEGISVRSAGGSIYTGVGESADALVTDVNTGIVTGKVYDRAGNSRNISFSF